MDFVVLQNVYRLISTSKSAVVLLIYLLHCPFNVALYNYHLYKLKRSSKIKCWKQCRQGHVYGHHDKMAHKKQTLRTTRNTQRTFRINRILSFLFFISIYIFIRPYVHNMESMYKNYLVIDNIYFALNFNK